MKALTLALGGLVLAWQLVLVLAVAFALIGSVGSSLGGAVGLIVYAAAVGLWVKLIQRFIDRA